MIRRIALLTLSALLAASWMACEKSGATERQKEPQANEQAAQPQSPATEQNPATEKMQSAQAKADKGMAEAKADFEKTVEDYRHARNSDLSDVDRKIADVQAKADTAIGKAKLELKAKLTEIRTAREEFVREMRTLDRATAATWGDVKANVDKAWDSLKDTVDDAENPKPATHH
jgi:hypothetical protein